ncbi:Hypothetical predicted protein, partial [Pelobates cultripes]
ISLNVQAQITKMDWKSAAILAKRMVCKMLDEDLPQATSPLSIWTSESDYPTHLLDSSPLTEFKLH